MSKFFKTAVTRKIAMALSGIFLVIFLTVHLFANMLSVISSDAFNSASHFMGTNPFVQFFFQPILMAGVIFHFVMGYVLEIQNRKARGKDKYASYNGSANSTWVSRNMIISGMVILLFLVLHLKDFWVEEMNYKYIAALPEDSTRYYAEMVETFSSPYRVCVYVLAFVFLCLHLLHGVKSSMQSIGACSIRKRGIEVFGKCFAYIVSGGFIFIALFHYFNNLNN